ncbi:MAG: hypothetical protein HYU52_07120 [Acidobacteria bacterium]|nr:hypothetical protein [Acidobacteriota bacterium]
MTKSIPAVLAAIALTGCMKSYPLWDPPPPQAEPAPLVQVTVEGTVIAIDEDDESLELEVATGGSDETLRIEFGSTTVVFPTGSRDRAVSGDDGLEMLDEGDHIVVNGLKSDDDSVRAREIAIAGRAAAQPAPAASATAAVPAFTPTQRVSGVVRAVDASAGRIVIETDGDGVVAFYGDRDTPVFYKGVIYQMPSLEVGDTVTVTIGSTDEGDPATPWITAVDVSRSVSHDGSAPVAKVRVPEPPKPDVQLEAMELEGTVKRLEAQGFELETGEGALRYVTADRMMPVAPATVERVSDLEVGMKIRVRVLEVGDRIVAQKITMLE